MSARAMAGASALLHPRAPRARRRRAASASTQAVGAARYPGRRAGQRGRLPGSRRMRDVLDGVAGFRRPESELPRQQRVGGLIRRQVRRDVQDAHSIARAPQVQ